MEKSNVSHGDKEIVIDEHVLGKGDLLRAISWLDYLPENVLTDKDTDAREKLIKLINHLTRNG